MTEEQVNIFIMSYFGLMHQKNAEQIYDDEKNIYISRSI